MSADVTTIHIYQEGSRGGCTTCGLGPGAAVHNLHQQVEIFHGERVDHPAHYGGADNPYEAIKVIEAWSLNFCLGNAVKYISRLGKKAGTPEVEDLKKARWYLDREIKRLEEEKRG